jgi:hypothetical protein
VPSNAMVQYEARYCDYPPPFALSEQAAKKGATPSQREGLRYEAKVLAFLTAWCGGNGYVLKTKPWIAYRDCLGRVKYCQPDAVLSSITDDNVILVEIKLRHTRDAFKQLRQYRDLLAELHPTRHIVSVEVCRHYDPAEFATNLMTELRPHPFPHAAIVFEPRDWEGH